MSDTLIASAPGPDRAAGPDQGLWRDLAAGTDARSQGTAWIALCCRAIEGARTGVVAILPGAALEPVICAWPATGPADPVLLRASLEAIKAGRGTVQPAPALPGQTASIRVAYPIRLTATADDSPDTNPIIAACAIDLAADPGRDVRPVMRQLQWAAAWLRDGRRKHDNATLRASQQRLEVAMDLLAAVLEQPRFSAACRVSATELATRFACERVSIGFTSGRRSRVAAISHTAQFGREMSLVRCLAATQDEAIDQHCPVLFDERGESGPASETWSPITQAHASLARQHGSAHVLTVPMFARDRFVGGITFERGANAGPSGQPFDQATIDLADSVAAILGPALLDKRELDRAWPISLAVALGYQAAYLFGPGHWGRKLGLAGLALILAFAFFARGPYRVAADSRIEGSVQRAMVAPFDGFIADSQVKAGDTVRQSQTLAILDDRDLILERLRWVTERQQHLAEYDQALSQAHRADAARFRAQTDAASAQMQLIDAQLARTRITAPFAGLVVAGDLSQSIGAPTRRGDVLFEIAPLDDYRIVLHVDERQIADIHPGQTGALLVNAVPGSSFPLIVERVTPVAEAHDGKMRFKVDAALLETSPRLRPGMEGLAKIDAGEARIVWIWFRTLLHWVRVQSWAYLG